MPRKLKPASIKRMEGNPSKTKIKPGVAAIGTPYPADELSDDGQALFYTVMRSMPEGFFSAADSAGISNYCQLIAMQRKAMQAVNARGFEMQIETARGVSIQPLVRFLRQNALTIKVCGAQLGLDPVSRGAIEGPPPSHNSKFAGLLKVTPDDFARQEAARNKEVGPARVRKLKQLEEEGNEMPDLNALLKKEKEDDD